MVSSSTRSQRFAQDLWTDVLTQLDSHANIIEITVGDFNLLGEDGERFLKDQLSVITNNSVEFFSDTTNTDRIYLASPASLGMNFTISMTGERLRALTPISSFQVDQGYDPAYGMQPEPYYHQEFMQQPELDYHQEVMQQPQMVPNTMYIAILSHPAYYTQEWAPMPVQQYPTAEPFDQGTQAVWPTDVSSPAPVQASYNNPVPLPTQPYTDSQHISPAPVQASYSNPVSLPTQSYTDAQHVTSQPAPEQKSTESTTPQADQLSKSPSEDSTTTQSTPDDESSSEEEEEEEYIPRPPNAFMIYRSFHCHQVQRAVLGIHNSRISQILGAQWKAMSAEEKQPWRDEAVRVDAEHKRLYPNWKYKPRKRGDKKGGKKGGKRGGKNGVKNGVNKASQCRTAKK